MSPASLAADIHLPDNGGDTGPRVWADMRSLRHRTVVHVRSYSRIMVCRLTWMYPIRAIDLLPVFYLAVGDIVMWLMSRHVGDRESPGQRDTCVNTACSLSSRDKAGVTRISRMISLSDIHFQNSCGTKKYLFISFFFSLLLCPCWLIVLSPDSTFLFIF